MIALVPVHNDAYCLGFCLESLAPVFDQVLVFDDGSTDDTGEVLEEKGTQYPNITVLLGAKQHGPGVVRKILARQAREKFPEERDVFWLESDFVLRDGAKRKLKDICQAEKHSLLGFLDLWGDLHHATHRGVHYETPCYIRVIPSKVNFEWFSHAHFEQVRVGKNPIMSRTAGFLFFHLRSVKPDRRLLERGLLSQWVKAGRHGNSDDFIERFYGDLTPVQIHAKAMNYLFHSRQHKIVKAFPKGVPRLPKVLVTPEAERFVVLYEYDEDTQMDQPFDRIDRVEEMAKLEEGEIAALAAEQERLDRESLGE